MPAKKRASKKRKTAKATRKKVARTKAKSRKKTAGKKRKVTRKKASTKKASKRKKAARKKPAARKTAKKKTARKKATTKKKAAKTKRVTKKRAATRKASKKKVTRKKATRKKPAAKKKAAKKKAAKKKPVSRKKPAAKKAPARKKAAAKKATTRKTVRKAAPRSRGDVLSGPIHGVKPYVARRGEDYMGKKQLEHFETILKSWKRELMTEVDRTVHHMQDEAANFPDPNDRATQESEFGLELRTRDRERKLLRKINSALSRIEDGTYGYCEETGEEIGLKRLEARPVATLCLEAQERREMAERQYRDRDDRYR